MSEPESGAQTWRNRTLPQPEFLATKPYGPPCHVFPQPFTCGSQGPSLGGAVNQWPTFRRVFSVTLQLCLVAGTNHRNHNSTRNYTHCTSTHRLLLKKGTSEATWSPVNRAALHDTVAWPAREIRVSDFRVMAGGFELGSSGVLLTQGV